MSVIFVESLTTFVFRGGGEGGGLKERGRLFEIVAFEGGLNREGRLIELLQ